jgi:hypothetical protein
MAKKNNEDTYKELFCDKRIILISGVFSAIETPDVLEETARLSVEWFNRYLPSRI